MADMYLAGIDYLSGQGIAQYEISNFAREGAESRHNLKYWRREPTWAWESMRTPCLWAADGHTIRLATSENLDDFLAESAGSGRISTWAKWSRLEEEWFLGLRLTKGVNLATLRDKYGRETIAAFRPRIDDAGRGGAARRGRWLVAADEPRTAAVERSFWSLYRRSEVVAPDTILISVI